MWIFFVQHWLNFLWARGIVYARQKSSQVLWGLALISVEPFQKPLDKSAEALNNSMYFHVWSHKIASA